jgi:hypothetical protein
MFDVLIKDIIDLVLRVDVGAYSFEAANPATSTNGRCGRT